MANLLQSGYFALFLIVSLGIMLGRLKVKGFSLDLSAIIFVAMIFGHYGIIVPGVFQKFGLLLFIFSVGIQAGPGFFSSFKSHGLPFLLITLILILSAGLISWLVACCFGIHTDIVVGLFTGALTSTPGLAAAIESTQSPLTSIAYGVAYPFGVIGVILFTRLIPKVAKINIKNEEEKYIGELKKDHPEIVGKVFQVKNQNIFNKSIGDLKIRTMTGAVISRVRCDNHVVTPDSSTVLIENALIKAVGTPESLKNIEVLIGPESKEEIILDKEYDVRWILVTNKEVINKTLGQLNLFENFNATITRIRRSGVDIVPKPHSSLRFGDKILVAVNKGNIASITRLFGNEDKKLSETDFFPIALGIVLGLLLGMIEIPLWGGQTFSLGITGGVLISALVLSSLGKTGPIIWNISGSANQLLRQLGLLMFLASVGTQAGSTMLETIREQGIELFAYGALITLVPMVLSFFIGSKLLKINFLSLLGVLAGSMTSTPGLTAVTTMTDSEAPSISYATVYPAAMVVLIIIAQLLAHF